MADFVGGSASSEGTAAISASCDVPLVNWKMGEINATRYELISDDVREVVGRRSWS